MTFLIKQFKIFREDEYLYHLYSYFIHRRVNIFQRIKVKRHCVTRCRLTGTRRTVVGVLLGFSPPLVATRCFCPPFCVLKGHHRRVRSTYKSTSSFSSFCSFISADKNFQMFRRRTTGTRSILVVRGGNNPPAPWEIFDCCCLLFCRTFRPVCLSNTLYNAEQRI